MEQDDLRLEFVSVKISYPPRGRFPGGHLAKLFAEVQDLFRLESFSQDSDSGATFESDGQRTLIVARDAMLLESTPDGGIEMAKREESALLKTALEYCEIRIFAIEEITLRAKWQAPPDAAPAPIFFQDRVNVSRDAFDLLGDVHGTSLTFSGLDNRDEFPRHRHWNLELAPFYRDPNEETVWIELQNQFHDPTMDTGAVEELMQSCYAGLPDRVLPFLRQIYAEGSTEGGQSDEDDS